MSQHRAERVRRGGRFRLLIGVGLLACVSTTGTWAFWTDQVTVAGTTMTAGTIDLRVNGQDAVTGYAGLTLPAMVPGSSSAAVLTVANSGTSPVRMTAASTATNADGKNLAGALQVKVTADTAVTGSGSAATCAGAALAGSATALGTTLVPARTLSASESTRYCVQVTLPSGAASALQGATTAVTLAFTGTSDLG